MVSVVVIDPLMCVSRSGDAAKAQTMHQKAAILRGEPKYTLTAGKCRVITHQMSSGGRSGKTKIDYAYSCYL